MIVVVSASSSWSSRLHCFLSVRITRRYSAHGAEGILLAIEFLDIHLKKQLNFVFLMLEGISDKNINWPGEVANRNYALTIADKSEKTLVSIVLVHHDYGKEFFIYIRQRTQTNVMT